METNKNVNWIDSCFLMAIIQSYQLVVNILSTQILK